MATVTLKEADLADVAAIRDIAYQTWGPTYQEILSTEQIDYMLGVLYSTEKISGQISNDEQTYLLVIEDGQPVAFASYSPRAENPDIYKLHKLYCMPQTQGKGYGRLLVDEVAKRVLDSGKNTLDLNVNRYNKTITFYQKMGFAIAYEEDVPIGDYWMNDYVMRKVL